ncbi:hypothetical protein KZX45_16720 [Georgenia sp. EYE_87]|uniref:DUF5682 family protein n=1 Tax=Georgenia sp. EYE_87 TaxID=2853448 RepID=UPI0020040DAD|nr:DUF5682 family protein [Georgenia sp. EYE_87]MCK6212187.1 hypothetical protein [Georgenia sp. EYE_87]
MLSTAGVRDLAASLVSDELVVVPVRHHSPACAWQVRRAVEEHRPSVVLVEGPRSLTPLIPLLTHPEARMPLSVYTWAVRGKGVTAERWSAQLPFCDYSPELVALREAAVRDIPARFIDLDLAEQSLACAGEYGPDAEEPLLDEHHYRTSARLRALAEQLGCRDHEDLWEHLLEADAAAVPAAEHTARVAAWCQLARQDHPAAELDRDGTTAREAEMVWHIAQALTGRGPGDGPVLVVVGGFHAVALPALLAEPPARPAVRADGVTGGAAVVRYTFERLERLNGYASGMTSPAWHQQLWQLMTEGAEEPRAHAALAAILDVAEELRRRTVPVPMPAVSAAFEQALRLAHLRDRAAPLRSDLVDAVTSCFVKGDADVEGALVAAVTRHVLTGTAVGTVPPGAGTPPLVADTLGRLRRQKLNMDGEPRTAALDLYRRPAHRETSRLLHGLALLGVPFAVRAAGPDFVHGHGLGRLQERWEYRWSPATDGALAEMSVLGETLPAAVATRFEAQLEAERAAGARSAPAATSLLVRACVLGLHRHVGEPLELVREALATDVAFDALAAATAQLALLREAREPLEARTLEPLPALLRTAYERTVFLGRELSGQECDPADAVDALVQLREVLLGEAGSALDADLYWQLVDRLASVHEAPLVRGGATGLRYSAGRLNPESVARAIAGHLSGTASAADGVGFVSGLLRTAREAAWQEPALLGALDGRLAAWERETFVAHLPELRLAFAGMTPRETDRIAQAVAALHGATDLGVLRRSDVDEGTVRRHLEVSRATADLLARDGLAAWGARA